MPFGMPALSAGFLLRALHVLHSTVLCIDLHSQRKVLNCPTFARLSLQTEEKRVTTAAAEQLTQSLARDENCHHSDLKLIYHTILLPRPSHRVTARNEQRKDQVRSFSHTP